jgi:hypothetical protein
MKLSEFLRSVKDKIVKKERINVVRGRTGYSEYTWWMTTVSFDEIETVDFDLLMEQIAEFEESFKGK